MLQDQVNTMKSSAWQLLDKFKAQVNQEIIVSDICSAPKDKSIDVAPFAKTISSVPGIYEGMRPSSDSP